MVSNLLTSQSKSIGVKRALQGRVLHLSKVRD
jgi:hypothetical protein